MKDYNLKNLKTEQEIMQNWPVDISKPLVSICCITYNHEHYIRDAFNGFLMQQTDFPFEVVVGEDCSTDNSRKIIEQYSQTYPNIIKLITSSDNVGVNINFERTLRSCQGEFIALCEGDDYWTDPCKLQKQVGFLENNKKYGMVYSKAKVFNDKNKSFEKYLIGNAFSGKELLLSNPIPTLTTVFRNDLYRRYNLEVAPIEKNWEMGDYPVWLWFLFNSKIYFMADITATYRLLAESASHSSSVNKIYKFKLCTFKISDFYAKRYCTDDVYEVFLEHRYFFLYLFCLKHNIHDKNEYIKLLKELKKISYRTKFLITIFYDLKFEYAFILLNQNHIFRSLLKNWGARILSRFGR